jgi:hypothetical protein
MKQSYRVFQLSARCSFLLGLFTFLGCSATPQPKSAAVNITETTGLSCAEMEKPASGARIYTCSSDQDELFITLIKDCSLPEPITLSASTRKLLVGMLNTTILDQGPIVRGEDKVLHSLVTGIVDATPLVMSTFTQRSKGCVEDVVMWQQSPELITKKNLAAQEFQDLSTQVYQSLKNQDSNT